MNEFIKSEEGYIVYKENGFNLYSSWGYEKWFATYKEAIDDAVDAVNKYANDLPNARRTEIDKVIVYKGKKEVLHTGHSCPCGQVVFYWSNYHKGY